MPMTVQELSALHRRYADLSHRFRAAWTFHQFLQSLQKSAVHPGGGDLAPDFQTLYNELKEVSEKLSASESERVRTQLDAIEARLGTLVSTLEAEDSKLPPYALRQFFQRVKQYDDKILTQLVKFYFYANPRAWPPDRLDKVDFLLARLSGEEDDRSGRLVMRDRHRLREIFEGLWAMTGAPAPPDEDLRAQRERIEALRVEAGTVEDLDQLNDRRLVRRFRSVKHALGLSFFHPDLLLAVQEANLAVKARVEKLYRQEERRIAEEYQRVFELEREVPVDMQLDQELTQFRQDVERLEAELQRDEVNLEHLAQVRQWVKSLVPRLTAAMRKTGTAVGPAPEGLEKSLSGAIRIAADLGEVPPLRPSRHEDLLAEPFARMSAALLEIDPGARPESVVIRPEIFPMRLEPREVVAHRRLAAREACDGDLELFLLEAASLRVLLSELAQEIAGLLDESSVTGDSPIYHHARLATSVADEYAHRFQHLLTQAVTTGALDEGRELQLLHMRLLRNYAGLWLLAYKPLHARRPGGTLA